MFFFSIVGQRFAYLEMKAVVSHILRNFEILDVSDYKPELCLQMILKSLNGVKIRLKEREF